MTMQDYEKQIKAMLGRAARDLSLGDYKELLEIIECECDAAHGALEDTEDTEGAEDC